MTDIVEQLRTFYERTMRISGPGESGTMIMLKEAADEIERLDGMIDIYARKMTEATEEIERLRTDCETFKEELRGEQLLAEDRAEEIERLRAERDDYRQCAQTTQKFAQIKDAEIDRLRAALQDMIEISQSNSEASLMLLAIRKCAQHALEQKP